MERERFLFHQVSIPKTIKMERERFPFHQISIPKTIRNGKGTVPFSPGFNSRYIYIYIVTCTVHTSIYMAVGGHWGSFVVCVVCAKRVANENVFFKTRAPWVVEDVCFLISNVCYI